MLTFEFPKVVKTQLLQYWLLPSKLTKLGLSLDCA